MTCHTKANQKSQSLLKTARGSGRLHLPLGSPDHPEPAHPCLEGKSHGKHLGILSDSRVTRGQGVTQVPVAPGLQPLVAVMSKADGCVVRGEVGLHSRWALHRQRFPLMQIAPDDNLKKKKKILHRERERENWRKHLMCEQYSL